MALMFHQWHSCVSSVMKGTGKARAVCSLSPVSPVRVGLTIRCASVDDDEWFKNETEIVKPMGASTKLFAGDFNLVDYDPTDCPEWRQGFDLPSTSIMLQDIGKWMEQWKAAEATVSILPTFATMLAARFIFFNNKAEGTGLPDEWSTRKLLENKWADVPEKQLREVLQMHDSMTYLHQIRQDRLQQGESPLESVRLTVETVLEAHRLLTDGLVDCPGKLRGEDVYSGVPGGGKFYYDPPHLLPSNLETAVQLYNALLSDLVDACDAPDINKRVYNLAARLFVQLVTVHPFDDGNGRVCRLLVNHVLSAITPFPSPLYVEDGIRSQRTYVKAIMAARDLSDAKLTRIISPKDVSALFIESAWQTWGQAAELLERHSALKKMRGRLLPNSFTAAHYGLLADIGLSQEEKQNELATVQIAVEAAKDKATAVESGHVYECSVELCHGTFASILVLHNSQLKHTQQAMYSQLHKAE